MTDSIRVHLTFALEPEELPFISDARHCWDPVMAGGVPPHVTLVYPEEFVGEALLIERAHEAAATLGPFSMQSNALVTNGDDGAGGVFASVSDPTGSWFALRSAILQPPFEPRDVLPHITIVHPRTSRNGAQAWSDLQGSTARNAFAVREFALTSTNVKNGMTVRKRFLLTGTSRQLCAAVILVDGDKGLLALRAEDREWYPGVWDLVGGRVESRETLAATACREVREELAVSVSPSDLHHVDTLITNDAEVVIYAAARWDGVARNASDEHSEIRWCDSSALNELELSDPRLVEIMASATSAGRRW